MQHINFESLNVNQYVNKELLKYYLKGWGNVQVCDYCGYVSPYGPFSHRLKCCGKITRLVLEQDNNQQSK